MYANKSRKPAAFLSHAFDYCQIFWFMLPADHMYVSSQY